MSFVPRSPREDVNYWSASPLREAALLLGAVLGVVGVLSLVAVMLVDRLMPLVPASWESLLLPREVGLIEDDARQPELEALLGRLAAHWSENPYELRIGIVDREQPNAFAFPGGLILVTSGLLDAAETENELAFILGHELGHFRNRDHLRGLGRGLALTLVAGALRGSSSELLTLAGRFAERSFDRGQEGAADAFGLELVHTEYGHLAAATDFFGRFSAPAAGLERATATYLSTHPLRDARIEELNALADERGWPVEGTPAPLAWDE